MFKATGSYTNNCAGGGTCFDVNSGNLASSVFMANGYIDLGTLVVYKRHLSAWRRWHLQRGQRSSGQRHKLQRFCRFRLHSERQLRLAWNVQAGLTFSVNNNLKIDFSWRYLNLGSPQTAIVQCQNTPACPFPFYTLKDMTWQDSRIGFRWMIQPAAGIGVMAAQPVFAATCRTQAGVPPPPVYVPQPPLSSRG